MSCEAELNGPTKDFPSRQFRRTIRTAFISTARLGLSFLAVIQTTLARTLVRVPPSATRGSVQRILVVKLDELGDLVMAWPLIHTLRSRLPEAELTLLINRSLLGITEGMAGIRVMGVDVNCNKLLRPFVLPIRHFRLVRNRLRNEKFDVCFLPRRESDDVAATMLAYFTCATQRISFSEKSTPRKAFTNRSFDSLLTDVLPTPPVQHETKTNLSLLAAIGLSSVSIQRTLPLPYAAARFAKDSLPASGGPYVAICPTSGHSNLKQWGVEHFAEVASRLTVSGIHVVLVGGPADSPLGSVIKAACGGICLNFIGKTSLSQMAALLAQCVAFLGNDAGPLHVASALGLATVGVFGSSCWHQYGPWGPRHSVIVHEMSCSPCHGHVKNRCDVCIYNYPACMHRVSTAEVFEALSVITREGRLPALTNYS